MLAETCLIHSCSKYSEQACKHLLPGSILEKLAVDNLSPLAPSIFDMSSTPSHQRAKRINFTIRKRAYLSELATLVLGCKGLKSRGKLLLGLSIRETTFVGGLIAELRGNCKVGKVEDR